LKIHKIDTYALPPELFNKKQVTSSGFGKDRYQALQSEALEKAVQIETAIKARAEA